jgi:threonine aldolase
MIPGERGVMTPMQVEHAVRATGNAHYPRTSLVCIENTHNRMNGAIQPIDDIKGIRKVCDEKGISMHMDGARLLNASVASGISPAEYAKYFETVTICFSKGLGAPMGSMIAGGEETIQAVHRYRKMVGGGQRQVGVVAAAALYALDNHVERLAEDHENARRLAQALADMPGVGIDPDDIDTNIVYFDVAASGMTALDVVVEMAGKGVMMLPLGEMSVRCVTHLGVDKKDIEEAIGAFSEVFGK